VARLRKQKKDLERRAAELIRRGLQEEARESADRLAVEESQGVTELQSEVINIDWSSLDQSVDWNALLGDRVEELSDGVQAS
jgi:hypothetical protein